MILPIRIIVLIKSMTISTYCCIPNRARNMCTMSARANMTIYLGENSRIHWIYLENIPKLSNPLSSPLSCLFWKTAYYYQWLVLSNSLEKKTKHAKLSKPASNCNYLSVKFLCVFANFVLSLYLIFCNDATYTTFCKNPV